LVHASWNDPTGALLVPNRRLTADWQVASGPAGLTQEPCSWPGITLCGCRCAMDRRIQDRWRLRWDCL